MTDAGLVFAGDPDWFYNLDPARQRVVLAHLLRRRSPEAAPWLVAPHPEGQLARIERRLEELSAILCAGLGVKLAGAKDDLLAQLEAQLG